MSRRVCHNFEAHLKCPESPRTHGRLLISEYCMIYSGETTRTAHDATAIKSTEI